MSELMRELNRDNRDIEACPVTPENLAELLKLMDEGTVSGKLAKAVFEQMYATGKRAGVIVEEKGLVQVRDEGTIESVVDEVLADNPAEVERYKAGNEKLIGFFVGQIMKKTKGKANPKLANEILLKKLSF
jgi:aspartyl-tRNA(Asn)/glutamyl-tRNA(Gln) amidotransferase subunit B